MKQWTEKELREHKYEIENAKIIQDFCRKVLDKVLKEKEEKQKKLAELFDKLYRKKFLSDLKNVARKCGPLIKEDTRKRKHKLDKLRRVVKNNDKSKNLDTLKKYWDKWRNSKGDIEEYALTLQKKHWNYILQEIEYYILTYQN